MLALIDINGLNKDKQGEKTMKTQSKNPTKKIVCTFCSAAVLMIYSGLTTSAPRPAPAAQVKGTPSEHCTGDWAKCGCMSNNHCGAIVPAEPLKGCQWSNDSPTCTH